MSKPGESVDRLSKIPGFDPLRAEILPEREGPPALPSEQLSPEAVRLRFAEPREWTPEFIGDTHPNRIGEPRPAAVLIALVQGQESLHVLLTERTTHLSSHAGQIAFPGGRVDEADESVIAAALREAHEEVGLHASRVDVLGTLPEYLTGTGYRVTPVVAMVKPPLDLTLQQDEVAEAFEVPLTFLMNPRHHQRRIVRWDQGERGFYAMPYRPSPQAREYFIWGATAAMLRNLYWFLAAR